MSEGEADRPVVIEIRLADADLAGRLAVLLAEVSELRLAAPGESADVALVPASARQTLPERDRFATPLTLRELEVLALMAEGASNKTIARRLGISVHTAKFHVGQLLDKLDATGRTDAVAHAARRGVLQF